MIKTLILSIFFMFLAACASESPPVSISPDISIKEEENATAIKPRADWEVDWEKTMALAKKEGQVFILTSEGSGEKREALTEGFMKKYGISVELVLMPSGMATQKIITERRAGLYLVDIFIAGGTSIRHLKSINALAPIEKVLVLPEVTSPKIWWRGERDYIDKDRLILAFAASPSTPWVINSDIIRPENEPKSWKELLKPEWKGKVYMGDPSLSGSPNTIFTFVAYYRPDLGLQYWRDFAKQEPIILRNRRLGMEWLSKGKVNLVIGPGSTYVMEFQKVGVPVKRIMPQGLVPLSSGSGNVALISNAPHPNAAKIYLNWLLTKEAQTFYSRAMGYQSGRVDVPVDHLEPMEVRQPEVEYIFTSHEDFDRFSNEARKDIKEIFRL